MDISALKYPNKSHRKSIAIPQESNLLAELMGIEFGDGGINNLWQLVIYLNAEADLEYSRYVANLLNSLFDIKVYTTIRPIGKRLKLVCSGRNLIDFLVIKGAVRGDKIRQAIDIPGWILKNDGYQRKFVRGLIDTDGCLYIHTHLVSGKLYRNIGLCFTSYSRPLVKSVASIFVNNGIKPHLSDEGRRIYLYKSDSVVQYLKIFGSSNPRITRKFSEWRDG